MSDVFKSEVGYLLMCWIILLAGEIEDGAEDSYSVMKVEHEI